MSKEKLKQRCREILNKYKVGDKVNYQEQDFLISVFENHENWGQKKGVGVHYISIMKNSFNKCFQLVRFDDTRTDISFMSSIKNNTALQNIKKACRSAIRPEIVKFRNENVIFGVTKCAISGEILTKKNTHIDHYDFTFNEVVNKWLDLYPKGYKFEINKSTDNCVDTFFVNKWTRDSFIDFHNNNTHLRAVTKDVNLKRKRI